MSLFDAAIGVPIWLLVVIIVIPSAAALFFGVMFFKMWSNPEIKTLLKAIMNPNLYVVMDHTTYGYVRFHVAKLGNLEMEGPEKMGHKFIPRDEGHVEQSANLRIVHTIQGHPYPVNPLTAYAIEGCCEKLRDAGLPLNINVLDALFRARLDEKQLCGYTEFETEEQVIDDDGNLVFTEEQATDENGDLMFRDEPIYDEDGNVVFVEEETWDEKGVQHIICTPQTRQVPVMAQIPVMHKVKKTAQFQLSEDEFEQLEQIKDDLDHTFVGYDHLGGSVFAWQHVSDVVSLGASLVSTDVQALVDNARREAILKTKKKEHNLIVYAIVAFILCIGAYIVKLSVAS